MRVRVEKRSGPSPSPEVFYCYKIWEMRKNKQRTRERTTVWRGKTWALWRHRSQVKQVFPGGRSNQLDPMLPTGQER